MERSLRNVGAARAAGFAASGLVGRPDVWFSTTDADSVVPDSWFVDQLTYWADHDAMAGDRARRLGRTRRRDPAPVRRRLSPPPRIGPRPRTRREPRCPRGRLPRGRGFRALATGEDVDLVTRLGSAGHRVAWDEHTVVTTSDRRDPRAPRGFGDHFSPSLPARIHGAHSSGRSAGTVRGAAMTPSATAVHPTVTPDERGAVALPVRPDEKGGANCGRGRRDLGGARNARGARGRGRHPGELTGRHRGPGELWGCGPPNRRRCADAQRDRRRLRTRRQEVGATGAHSCTHALVTARTDSGRAMFAVDLRGGQRRRPRYVARGRDGCQRLGAVDFVGTPAVRIGEPGAYLDRPGFWHGAIGVAACWYGGAVAVADELRRRVGDDRSGSPIWRRRCRAVRGALCAGRRGGGIGPRSYRRTSSHAARARVAAR